MFAGETEEFQEDAINWSAISNILNEVTAEICGRKTWTVAKPWTEGHEEELQERHRRIN